MKKFTNFLEEQSADWVLIGGNSFPYKDRIKQIYPNAEFVRELRAWRVPSFVAKEILALSPELKIVTGRAPQSRGYTPLNLSNDSRPAARFGAQTFDFEALGNQTIRITYRPKWTKQESEAIEIIKSLFPQAKSIKNTMEVSGNYETFVLLGRHLRRLGFSLSRYKEVFDEMFPPDQYWRKKQ